MQPRRWRRLAGDAGRGGWRRSTGAVTAGRAPGEHCGGPPSPRRRGARRQHCACGGGDDPSQQVTLQCIMHSTAQALLEGPPPGSSDHSLRPRFRATRRGQRGQPYLVDLQAPRSDGGIEMRGIVEHGGSTIIGPPWRTFLSSRISLGQSTRKGQPGSQAPPHPPCFVEKQGKDDAAFGNQPDRREESHGSPEFDG